MNFLIIGDIFGRPGRTALKNHLSKIQAEHEIDFTIINGENAAHGKGLTVKTMQDLLDAGGNFITTGDHIWKHSQFFDTLNDPDAPVIRPANYPEGAPGTGYKIVQAPSGKSILIINLIGRTFMKADTDCPFRKADQILAETAKQKPDITIVDFHAEATSDKVCMGHYLVGRATIVYGTHSHVPTADARLLNKGTAYITDVGMTGVYDSAIGVDKDIIIQKFLTQLPIQHEVAEGEVTFSGIKVTVEKGQAKDIKHILLSNL